MHCVLRQYGRAIQVLKILAIRDETIYGIVTPQTAHTSFLLADAYLRRSYGTISTDYTNEESFEDAQWSSAWAQKALQIMSIVYGRNHELTYSTHVVLDMALNQIEREERTQEAAKAAAQLHAEEVAMALIAGVEYSPKVEDRDPNLSPRENIDADEADLGSLKIQCSACATVGFIQSGLRIVSCSACGQFCTKNNKYIESRPGDRMMDSEDAFGVVMSSIMADYSATSPTIHPPGEMLPSVQSPFSSQGVMLTRATTCSIDFYDGNMRESISKISQKHNHEWHPCTVCSKPRASKR